MINTLIQFCCLVEYSIFADSGVDVPDKLSKRTQYGASRGTHPHVDTASI